jgi:hypothetical protein
VNHSDNVSAIEAWVNDGRSKLSAGQAQTLVNMALQNHRCADACGKWANGDLSEADAIEVFRREWVEEPLLHVIDHRSQLLDAAIAVRNEQRPVAELVLRATWLEHTLNILLAHGAIAAGLAGEELREHAKQVKAARMQADKLKKWRAYPGSPPLSDDELADLRTVFDQRNSAIHLEWVGEPSDDVASRLDRLRSATEKARTLCTTLGRLEAAMSPIVLTPPLAIFSS